MTFMLGNIRGPRRSQMIAQQKQKILAEQERVKKIEIMKSASLKEDSPVIEKAVEEVENIVLSEPPVSETMNPINDSVQENKEELVEAKEATKDVNVKDIVEDIENKEEVEAPSTESTNVSHNETVETTDLSGNKKAKSKKNKKNKKN